MIFIVAGNFFGEGNKKKTSFSDGTKKFLLCKRKSQKFSKNEHE